MILAQGPKTKDRLRETNNEIAEMVFNPLSKSAPAAALPINISLAVQSLQNILTRIDNGEVEVVEADFIPSMVATLVSDQAVVISWLLQREEGDA